MLQRFAFLSVLLVATAGAVTPDRSTLSYEDNVTINTACYDAVANGPAAHDGCVAAQLAALAKHPAPDRTRLSAERRQEISDDCDGLRRLGVAPYNDCLTREAKDDKANVASDGNDDGIDQKLDSGDADFAKVLVKAEADAPADPAKPPPLPKAVLPPLPRPDARTPMTPAELYKTLEHSIFVVGATRSAADARTGDILQGSAVAVAPHLLLTNCHVVNDRPVIVLLQDDQVWHAKLVGADRTADRCVLQADGAPLTPVPGVRPFNDIAVGEPVFAIGAPLALERTMTDGLVSGRRAVEGFDLIQTSAPVSPGSSGGGLFDVRGNLIGITTLASKAGYQNLNFAIAAADFWE